mmetsp:Transcript_10668/g.21353  ORF Transcript_10668/g.21353 Transcript_10668/m.21353 type:complete len:90 (-) Transcript_10668:282-551(-)
MELVIYISATARRSLRERRSTGQAGHCENDAPRARLNADIQSERAWLAAAVFAGGVLSNCSVLNSSSQFAPALEKNFSANDIKCSESRA